MIYAKAGLALTFNGEIYNYLEIKEELEKLGHHFISTSDTEVILHAWEEWGPDCLKDFNGMFAFVILDFVKNMLYAVRDRFGVKPVYLYKNENAVYIASEIKQIRTCPGYKFQLNEAIALQYLAAGISDHTTQTFDKEVAYLPGGHYLEMDLAKIDGEYEIVKWYELTPRPWHGTFEDAATQLRELLTDAVRLRLRSDVKVGSCLSGGLDSSSIVCIAADILQAQGDFAGQETVTACYEQAKYDEWAFAKEVVDQTRAQAHKVYPSFNDLKNEIGDFLWHQDEPVGSTSVFSQWTVFKATHEASLKVMIDGQGADEHLAGYGGNDMAFYTGLLQGGDLTALWDEAQCYRKEKGNWPVGFLLGAVQLVLGRGFAHMMPAKLRLKPQPRVDWLRTPQSPVLTDEPAHSLRENLVRQLRQTPLPSLLRYEDRNSMAWSVESRTPFMDYRLVEFTLGLPARFIYKRGVRKAVLRAAMSGVIPPAVENRKDKMGFVTPEELWLKGEGRDWFLQGVEDTLKLCPALFNETKVREHCNNMIDGRIPFDFSVWRIASFGKWYETMKQYA